MLIRWTLPWTLPLQRPQEVIPRWLPTWRDHRHQRTSCLRLRRNPLQVIISHSKMAADMAGSQTPADILSPAEEKPPPGNNKSFQDGRQHDGITDARGLQLRNWLLKFAPPPTRHKNPCQNWSIIECNLNALTHSVVTTCKLDGAFCSI